MVQAMLSKACDERGTTEYNMALGERRANSVKSYLQTKGVAPSRINKFEAMVKSSLW